MKQNIKRTKIKYIVGCALLCSSVYFLLAYTQTQRSSSRFKEAEDYFFTLASKDVALIDEQVALANQQILIKNARSMEEELRIRFANAVVVGDSIAEGLSGYDLLSASNVIAKRGLRTDNCEEEIDKVIALAPQHVFLNYGMNDLEFCRGDEICFVSQYEEVLKKLQEQLPNAKLYVSAVLATTSSAEAEVAVYKAYKKYNEALEELCAKLQVTYYNTNDLLPTADAYESDGVHPKYDYFPLWLQRMVETAGL